MSRTLYYHGFAPGKDLQIPFGLSFRLSDFGSCVSFATPTPMGTLNTEKGGKMDSINPFGTCIL